MKQSESSVRRKQATERRRDTSLGAKVRNVKFTPAEMAYDSPADVSDPKAYPTVARGDKQWRAYLSAKRRYVRLEPDVLKAFPTAESVNAALRALIETARKVVGVRNDS